LAQKLGSYIEPGHPEPICHRPFTTTLDGQPWSVAVGGPWLWAVRGSSSHKPVSEANERVSRVLEATPKDTQEVETLRLKSWANPLPDFRTFDPEGIREGVVLGVPLDLRRLACLLEHVHFSKLTLWDSTQLVGVRSLGLESRGKWRGYLAGLDSEADGPVFDFRPDGAAAFDLMSQLKED